MRKFIALLAAVLALVTALGLVLSIILQGIPGLPAPGETGGLGGIPQLSLDGFSEAEISLEPGGTAIILSSGCRRLSMVTSQEQVYSIAMGIEQNMGFRPLSHDLIGNMAGEFGIEVLMVKVESLKDGTYYAKLILRQGNKILSMDSRPSDAIAVAVRTESPVYVNGELLEKHGTDAC